MKFLRNFNRAIFAILTAYVLVYSLLVDPKTGVIPESYYKLLALQPSVTRGEAIHTLVTSLFLHASASHLAIDILFLCIMSKTRFLGNIAAALYFASGEFANLISLSAYDYPTITSSAAVGGILGAYLFFASDSASTVKIPALLTLAWILLQYYLAAVGTMGYAFWNQVGGFAAGFLMALLWTERQLSRSPIRHDEAVKVAKPRPAK